MAEIEYILRSDILYHIVEFEERCHNDRWTETHEIAYKAEIDQIPAADVAPVMHGQWIVKGDAQPISNDKVYGCSLCDDKNRRYYKWQLSNYCPSCGAKMDGGFINVDR